MTNGCIQCYSENLKQQQQQFSLNIDVNDPNLRFHEQTIWEFFYCKLR